MTKLTYAQYTFFALWSILFTLNCGAQTTTKISAEDFSHHVKYLASDELKGRMTGTEDEIRAAEYISKEFKRFGLSPYFGGSWFQKFPFISGVELAGDNSFNINGETPAQYKAGSDFIPLGFSSSIQAMGEVVFAGYGISSEKNNYDDYKNIDVKDKIVLVLRYNPEYDNPHSKLEEVSSFRYKTGVAKEKGAKAILFVNGIYPVEEDKLTPLTYDRAASVDGIAAMQISRAIADKILSKTGFTVKTLQEKIKADGKPLDTLLTGSKVTLATGVNTITKEGTNVAGVLYASEGANNAEYILIGAHYDHLGMGGANSLYRGDVPQIHNGADDNASGTSGVLELAEYLAANKNGLKRNIIFACFSGEELGLLGSSHMVNNPTVPNEKIAAMINLDMIGRLTDSSLIVYGTGTSSSWKDLLNKKKPADLKLTLNDEGYGPSDHSSFYGKKIPVLFFFTGTHSDYHRPGDDADKINYSGLQTVVEFVSEVTAAIAAGESRPDYIDVPRKDTQRMSGWKVYVGTIPDYAYSGSGLKITGVNEGSPAKKAGLAGGDIIVKFGNKEITNIYDYVYSLQELVPGDIIEVIVMRGTEKVVLSLELGAR